MSSTFSSISPCSSSTVRASSLATHVIDIYICNDLLQLQIEGEIGISPDSDIAIDDIFIDDGKCPSGIGSKLKGFQSVAFSYSKWSQPKGHLMDQNSHRESQMKL